MRAWWTSATREEADAEVASSEEDAALLPMADLLLGTTATLLLAVLVLWPQLGTGARAPVDPRDASRAVLEAAAAAGAPVLFAGQDGLSVFDGTSRTDIGLDEISGLTLQAAGPPLLVIGDQGDEAGFLAEARLAALGSATIRRVRLPAACARLSRTAPEGIACE